MAQLTVTVPSRFNGPAGSVNGGYLCGRVAGYLDGPTTVTLHRPPPLDATMTVASNGSSDVRVFHGEALIASAVSTVDILAPDVPHRVTLDEARAARGRSRYFDDPIFPTCFVCGTQRRAGDGLRIFPGPVSGRALWAAPWTPNPSTVDIDGRVRPEIVWAALDCPSGIAVGEATAFADDCAVVLGRMTAWVTALPMVGDECQVIAWPLGQMNGRKLTAGSALLGPGGEVLAVARAVWLTVPRPAPRLVAEEVS
jgi:hypothetical protein